MMGRGRLRLAALVIASALVFASSAAADGTQPVALVYHGRRVSREALRWGAQVLTYQVNHQLRHFWPGPAIDLRPRRGPPANWPVVELVNGPPPPKTAGYHLLRPNGSPLAVVYLRKWGPNWTVGASHELLEMLIDPQGDTISGNYLEEVSDPVQFIWYRLRGTYVADFVTPAWFGGTAGPWDMAGQLHSPYAFGRGGEQEYHDQDQWIFIGPGAHMRKLPKPVKVNRPPKRYG